MNHRQRVHAIMHYENYDAMPLVHFGYWKETLEKWVWEGHASLSAEEIDAVLVDGSEAELAFSKKLGFDFNWYSTLQDKGGWMSLYPKFKEEIVKDLGGGACHMRNEEGMIVLQREGATGIPAEIGYTLVDRRSWEEQYLPKLQFNAERVNIEAIKRYEAMENTRETPLGVYFGSLYGQIRNYMGLEAVTYLQMDDEELFDEIVDTIAELCYKTVEEMLKSSIKFDFAHFWEDICFKNGPIVTPSVFYERFGPLYKRLCGLVNAHGIDIVSLDCDGKIDALIPTWLENGVNTMFPIEVGTWEASIAPWRKQYGKALRGVGGMDKRVFAEDFAAVDKEIERLKRLVELGGYIPCPDHRIAPDAKWDNVRYYCDKMRKVFGG